MIAFVGWLIFIKIVSKGVKIQKDCDGKDCNKEDVLIEKGHDN